MSAHRAQHCWAEPQAFKDPPIGKMLAEESDDLGSMLRDGYDARASYNIFLGSEYRFEIYILKQRPEWPPAMKSGSSLAKMT